MIKTIYLIAGGMGNAGGLTQTALKIIKECDEIYAPQRLVESLGNLNENIASASIEETFTKVDASKNLKIGVLISGDTGFYSIAGRYFKKFSKNYEVKIICGINSMQYLCSAFGLSYEKVYTLSLHGRVGSVLGCVSYNEFVFVLTGGGTKAQDVINELISNGLDKTEVIIGENMGSPNERFLLAQTKEVEGLTFSDLTSLLIINKNYINQSDYFSDNDFIRGNVPMTKEAIRRIIVAEVAPNDTDIIFDIGSGTGSIACELGRKTFGLVYAIEKEAEALDLIKQNRSKLGVYNVIAVEGAASAVLENLPAPTKVFIGGSSGELETIINILTHKSADIKIVVSAITLETLNETINIFKAKNISAKIININVSQAKKTGDYNMMMALNPVYIISGKVQND